VTSEGITVMKGNVVTILTNIGSPPQNASTFAYTPWPSSFSSTDILSCKQWAVGSNGTVEVQYTKGGSSVILVPDDVLDGSGICGGSIAGKAGAGSMSNGDRRNVNIPIASVFLGILLSLFYVVGRV